MKRMWRPVPGLAAVVVVLTFTSSVVSAQKWTARTPDGQPDLQGIWVNFDSTPFEAPGGQPAAADLPQTSAPAPTPRPFAAYKDGTYLGWGSCRHGDIQASVTIAAGRITEAKVAQCWTRYSCNWIDPIVPQVVARQSPNVDYVSGATQSVDAFYWAVIDALSKAK